MLNFTRWRDLNECGIILNCRDWKIFLHIYINTNPRQFIIFLFKSNWSDRILKILGKFYFKPYANQVVSIVCLWAIFQCFTSSSIKFPLHSLSLIEWIAWVLWIFKFLNGKIHHLDMMCLKSGQFEGITLKDTQGNKSHHLQGNLHISMKNFIQFSNRLSSVK